MTYKEILKTVDNGDISPVYLLYGEEDFLIEEVINNIKASIIEPSMKDMNLSILYGDEVKAEAIIEKAKTFPFLAKKRVVIVKNTGALGVEEEKKLIPYILSPSPSTSLIFVADKINNQKKFYSTLNKKCVAVQFKRLTAGQAALWVSNSSKKRNIAIGKDAIRLLIDMVGLNLRRIDKELEKLSLYVANGTITPKDIPQVVIGSHNESIFDLTDAIGNKRKDKAFSLLNKIISSGEAPLALLGMIVRQFRLIWQVKYLKENERVPLDEIASKLSIPPFVLSKIGKQTKCFEFAALKDIFYLLKESDKKLKSDFPPKIVMETLLLNLL